MNSDIKTALEHAERALLPLSNAVFNDNGDMTISGVHPTSEQCVSAYFAVKAIRSALATPASAEPVKIMPRGGVERNWWEEYQLLLRRFKKLAKAARQCVEEVDANLAKDDWPVKYRAPFEGLTKLREALPETYEEHKARKPIAIDT